MGILNPPTPGWRIFICYYFSSFFFCFSLLGGGFSVPSPHPVGRVFCTLYPSGKNLCSVGLPVSKPWALKRPGRAKGPGEPFSPLYRSKNPPGPRRPTTGQNSAHIPFTRRAMRWENFRITKVPSQPHAPSALHHYPGWLPRGRGG